MSDSIGIVVLAAGKGTRLKLDLAKALCPIQGKTLVDYVLKEVDSFVNEHSLNSSTSLVVGHLKESVISHIEHNHQEKKIQFASQKEQLGTADALKSYFDNINNAWSQKYTLVICADTPLISSDELSILFQKIKSDESLVGVAATFETNDPTGYGRIVKGGNGFKIIEEKDASTSEKLVKEVNSGLYILKTEHIKNHLFSIDSKNKSNEYYLTDLFQQDFKVEACLFDNEISFLGVNNLKQLETCARYLQSKKIESLQLEGVRFINSSNCYIEDDVEIASGSVIYPSVNLFGETKIGNNCVIETGVTIKNSTIKEQVNILAHSYIEEAFVDSFTSIGPMARLRTGSSIGESCKIGNFVETKKVELSKGVKVSHLSYVGDAQIGENTNIGCGFITCNYDGANKHKTIIGKNSFIGSDCQMIAPIELGDEVYIGSGSTINQNVQTGAFAIARQRQVTRPDMAKKFIKTKKQS